MTQPTPAVTGPQAMTGCQLLALGYMVEDIQNHRLILTAEGEKALTDSALATTLIGLARNCTMNCSCSFRYANLAG